MLFSPISVYDIIPFSSRNYIADNVIDIPSTMLFGEGMRNRFGHGNETSVINWSTNHYHTPHRYSSEETLRPLEDIMDERTQSIKDMVGNDATYLVSYSGGVDSTAIICSLVRNGVKAKNIRAVGTKQSVVENPDFVPFMDSIGIRYTFTEDAQTWKNIRCSTEDVILNGNCADQLFGSIVFRNNPSMFDAPSMVAFKTLMFRMQDRISPCMEKIEIAHDWWVKYAKEVFNVDIINGSTLLWFLNYSLKWEYVAHTHQASLLDQSTVDRDLTFFDTVEFSNWSVLNHHTVQERNFFKNPLLYKKELKEYIYTVFKNDGYLRGKDKTSSLAIRPEIDLDEKFFTMYMDNGTFKTFTMPTASSLNGFAIKLLRKPAA